MVEWPGNVKLFLCFHDRPVASVRDKLPTSAAATTSVVTQEYWAGGRYCLLYIVYTEC